MIFTMPYNKVAGEDSSAHDSGPTEKYYRLLHLYYLWTTNFYRGDNYYHREIGSTLYSYINSNFETPRILGRIEQLHGQGGAAYSCFRFSSWLTIKFDLREKAVVELLSSLTQRERALGIDIGISGTIYRYKVINREKDRSIEIYLRDVNIIKDKTKAPPDES